jgi:hypothetical protein
MGIDDVKNGVLPHGVFIIDLVVNLGFFINMKSLKPDKAY